MAVQGTLLRGHRPTREQTAYRELESLRLWNAGCTTDQIATAEGVSDATVRKDLLTLGLTDRTKRMKVTRPDPPPVDWLHPPREPDRRPADRPALAFRQLLEEWETGRFESAHAHDVIEARLHGKRGWEKQWLDLIGQLERIVLILKRQHADSDVLRATALGRTRSERVDELGHGGGSVMQPVVRVVDQGGGTHWLGGQVEDGEDGGAPSDDLAEHALRVTPQLRAANGQWAGVTRG